MPRSLERGFTVGRKAKFPNAPTVSPSTIQWCWVYNPYSIWLLVRVALTAGSQLEKIIRVWK